jgi:polysaccharide biosynthesis/export protein
MSCRIFWFRVSCKRTAEKTACNHNEAFVLIYARGFRCAPKTVSNPDRECPGTRAEPGGSRGTCISGKKRTENAGRAISQPDRADGTGNPVLGRDRSPLYRLAKSDVLERSLTYAPEFNQTVTIQPDGYITLKEAGHLYVEGMTAQELELEIRAAYSKLLHDPVVTVILKDFEHPYFVASGEVGRPGKYELHGPTTVTAAVAMAGGFTQQSKHSQVVLFRRATASVVEARVLNVREMLKHRDLTEDPYLQPGDFVFVPRSLVSNIMRFIPATSMGMYTNSSNF